MRVALVHEFLTQFGGAERTLLAFKEIFPKAPIYTLVYNPHTMGRWFRKFKIQTSWLQKLPFATTRYRFYLPLMPAAIESFDFSGYDLVISDSSAFAKGVITTPPTIHISYIHTPTRYLWQDETFYRATAVPRLLQPLVKLITPALRRWDEAAAKRPNFLVANSKTVGKRIQRYYGRETTVIYPFINAKQFKIGSKLKRYYLIAGRIVPYKRCDIVCEAFKELKLPLVVAGSGWGEISLKKRYGQLRNITFLGHVSDRKLAQLYRECQALIFPALEDFGIVPVEAMASGRPVIAFRGGGATETVVDGKTGTFFDTQTPQAVVQAVKEFRKIKNRFNPRQIRQHAIQFDKSVFQREFLRFIRNLPIAK